MFSIRILPGPRNSANFSWYGSSFLGGAAAARRGAHMTITEFLDKLGEKGRLKADAIIQLICLIVLGLLIWYGMIIVNANWGNQLNRPRLVDGFPISGAAGGSFL